MKRFAKLFLLVFFFCFLQQTTLHAQGGRDRVEALRVAFITKKLELTAAESEKFWPVYNEYNDKLRAIRRNLRQSFRKAVVGGELTDAEAEDLYQLDLRSKQAEVDTHKLYTQKIKDILGARKLVKLRVAEEQFKREMINSLQQDKSD